MTKITNTKVTIKELEIDFLARMGLPRCARLASARVENGTLLVETEHRKYSFTREGKVKPVRWHR